MVINDSAGKPYLSVVNDGSMLKLKLLQSSAPDWSVNVDARVIPGLIRVLNTMVDKPSREEIEQAERKRYVTHKTEKIVHHGEEND